MRIKEFILNYFTMKTNIAKEKLLCDISYFDENYIDSLGIFELISTIEDKYNFEFTDDNFQDRNFVTINGISDIIKKKLNAL